MVCQHIVQKSGHTHVITQKGKDTRQPAIHVIADIGLLSVYGLLSVQKQFLVHFHLLFQSGIGAYHLAGLFLSLCFYFRHIFSLFCDRKNILTDISSRFATGNGFTGHHVLQGILIHLENLSFFCHSHYPGNMIRSIS